MLSALIRIFKVFVSECNAILKDRGVALLMIGAVCLYSLFYIVPFNNHVARDIPVAVIDHDNSSLSREFIRALNANEMIGVVAKVMSVEQAKQEYYKNNISAFLEIPSDFSKNLKRGVSSYFSAYLDSSFLIIYKQLATGLSEVSQGFGAGLEIKALSRHGINGYTAKAIKRPFETVSIPLYNPIGSYQNYIYPQVLIMVLQQTLLMGVGLMTGTLFESVSGIRRKINNKVQFIKFDKLSRHSDSVIEITLGKGLAYSCLYLIYAIAFFQVFPTFVNYRMIYNTLPMMAIMVPFIVSSAFLGISLGLFCRTRESAMFILVPSSVPFIFLPGFVWAKECIPDWMVCISKFIPTTSAIDGLLKVNQMGATFEQVKTDSLILIILSCFYFFVACITMRIFKTKTLVRLSEDNHKLSDE